MSSSELYALQPIPKTLDPAIGRQTGWVHAKAVIALGIDMQLNRVSSASPGRFLVCDGFI